MSKGDRVNLWEFSLPLFHEKDGGRYLGTGHLVITKDTDSSWINVGTYQIMSPERIRGSLDVFQHRHAISGFTQT